MKKYILITGGAGYVGSYLLRHLYTSNWNPFDYKYVVVDVGMFGLNCLYYLRPHQDYLFNMSVSKFFNTHPDVKYILKDTECIMHLSGLSNDPMADFDASANLKLNYNDTKLVVDKCLEYEIPRLIYASSASLYGSSDNICYEDSKIDPQSSYSQAKNMSELYIKDTLTKDEKCIPIILRKGTIMGESPRMRLDLAVNTFVHSAIKHGKIELFGGGENWRPLLSLYDAAMVYKYLMNMTRPQFKDLSEVSNVFNICSENYRISELGLKVGSILGVKVEANYEKPKDMRNYRIDNSLMKKYIVGPEVGYGLLSCVRNIRNWINTTKDVDNPVYNNINWIKNTQKVCEIWKKDFDLCNL